MKYRRTLFYTTALAIVFISSATSIIAISSGLTLTSTIAIPVREGTPIALPAGFQYPNGIAHASNGTLYVGSVTSGRILRIKPDGRIETFFPGTDEIFASSSLRLDEQGGILWGTSPDFLGVRAPKGEVIRRPHRIFAIDIRTGKVLRVILMPDGGFGNDMVLDANGGVYITDSSRPRIYYLAPGATQLRVWAEDERFRSKQVGLAGIAQMSNGVFIVGLFSDGKLFKLTVAALQFKIQNSKFKRKNGFKPLNLFMEKKEKIVSRCSARETRLPYFKPLALAMGY